MEKAWTSPKYGGTKASRITSVTWPAEWKEISHVTLETRTRFCCDFVVKQGKPTNDELEELGFEIAQKWKKLGRRLNMEEPKLEELHLLQEQLSEKGFHMLLHWKQEQGELCCDFVIKQGTSTNDESEELGFEIAQNWKKLGRRLNMEEPKLSEKGFHMLLHWKQEQGSTATYQALCDALPQKRFTPNWEFSK